MPTPKRTGSQPTPKTDLALGGLAVLGVAVFFAVTIIRRPHQGQEGLRSAAVVDTSPRITVPAPVEPPATTANAPAVTEVRLTATKNVPAAGAEAPHVAALTPAAVSDQPPAVLPAAADNLGVEAGVSAPAVPRPIKRIRDRTEANLFVELLAAPVVTLDRSRDRTESMQFVKANAARPDADLTLSLIGRRADLVGMPLHRGKQARLSAQEAKVFAEWAESLATNSDGVLAQGLYDRTRFQPRHIPTLMQVLMVADEPIRMKLARLLGRMGATEAARALVRIALFDPNPTVRQEAILGLDEYLAQDFVPELLQGFDHPWKAVAEHAAEALVELRRKETVPALLEVMHAPDPQAPYRKAGGPALYVKEVVRINHSLNCLMCHPPSFRTSDPLRREVPPLPEPEEKADVTPRGSATSYKARSKTRSTGSRWETAFVRADITFLKQDYSVMLVALEKEAMRPDGRWDLFVRERLATKADTDAAAARQADGLTGHQQAVAFALRELTGQEAGRNESNWRTVAPKAVARRSR